MRVTHLITPVVFLFILSIPVFAQPEKTVGPLLIAKPNPALADVNRLLVVIMPEPSEPNTGGLVWSGLMETVISKLSKAGIQTADAIGGNILEIPELRLNVDLFRCVDLQKYVFRVQTSFARKVLLENSSKVYIKADVFQTEPFMQIVQDRDMPDAVINAVSHQVDVFITAWSVAKEIDKQTDVNKSLRRLHRSDGPQETGAVPPKGEVSPEADKGQVAEYKFVASKNSKVFHKPDCPFAAKISAKNLVVYESREQAVAAGKRPCKSCNP